MARDTFDEMDRLFDQMRRSFASSGFGWGADDDLALDMTRGDGEYVLVADIPGFERDEIDLRAEDGDLVLDATHEIEADELARERHVFERVSLPAGVDAEGITATYRNGVLEVHLPLADGDEGGRRIDVN